MFTLDARLAQDSLLLGRFPLCQLRLLNDANYPWFILVPERADIREIYQLTAADQQQLLLESSHLARHLADHFHADKLNIAALGNIVPQLHLHHIVRYQHDPAWPAPVWGKLPATPYTAAQIATLRETFCPALGTLLTPAPI